MPIRVCVAGVTGWTGSAVAAGVDAAEDLVLAAGVSRSHAGSFSTVAEALEEVAVDVLVDYTSPEAVKENVHAALDRGVAVVVGSSGLSASEYREIDERARKQGIGVVAAGNFSLTAALLLRFATEAAQHLGSWEIIDYASHGKPDAPSGTARELAERLESIGSPAVAVPVAETLGAPEARGATVGTTQVHSLRLPSFSVSTEIVLAGTDERLSIRHDAGSTAAPYVAGTLAAIREVGRRVGLIRGLDRLF